MNSCSTRILLDQPTRPATPLCLQPLLSKTYLELDGPRSILIKHVKYVVRKLARVTKGEELFVDLDKLLLVQLTRWAVLDEALVPLLQLLLVDCTGPSMKRQEESADWGLVGDVRGIRGGAGCIGGKGGILTVGVLLQISELIRGQLGLTFTHFCA
jgi:hypothetical protein